MSYSGAPPLKRFRDDEVVNPCSGQYEGSDGEVNIELIVDIDRVGQFVKPLGVVSGTVSEGPWLGQVLFFKAIPSTLEVTGGQSDQRELFSYIKAIFSNGTRASGILRANFSWNSSTGEWTAEVDIEIDGQGNIHFNNLKRISKYFKEVKLDIDYTEKVIWPTVVLKDLPNPPPLMEERKLDPFSAFEDAGLKLNFDQNDCEQLVDPTPNNPWTKADLYEAMMTYFDESEESDENIWCMMGTTPPDKRYMGFSFDRKGRHGFGLFTKHRSFEGLESKDRRKRAEAHRRLLHYLVHECGHCLGLKHPFEIGAPDSLSWMNYAWKYDVCKDAGSFYDAFNFTFSDRELLILRHSPAKVFRAACSRELLSSIMGSGYTVRSEAPDAKLADDDDDFDLESEYNTDGYGAEEIAAKPKPKRKVSLDLKVPQIYTKGQLLNFEARLKNVGKLPVLIEGDLSVESGNLQVYLTRPDGRTHNVEPFVRPIYTGYSKPKVLYTPEDEEGSDRYSEMIALGEGSEGYQVDMPGAYEIRAVYSGGRYKVTSETYSFTVEEDDDEDAETNEEIVTAATLQASSYEKFQKTLDFWKRMESKPVEKKKSKVATLIAFFDGLANKQIRKHAPPTKKRKRGHQRTGITAGEPELQRSKLLKDTGDIIQYYQQKGGQQDNMEYSKLVLARGKLYVAENNYKDADAEYNQMVNDLMQRGVKYDSLIRLNKKWNKIKNPPKMEDRYSSSSLQEKVNSVLTWAPTAYGEGEEDISGVGLGMPFSNFDSDQIQKASKIIHMLFQKYDETQDLYATIGYADKLQKGREVNFMVLRWALEAFIVHSMDAKKAGIKYPEPDERDESAYSDAAMVVTKREGQPQEEWMNYWRCDADFNYHHRHWHVVYVLARFLRRSSSGGLTTEGATPHLERQGELFGYMHSQMLARYDAERESWGLHPVQPWQFNETSMKFNAGFEFHSDRQWSRYAPRPEQKWRARDVSRFKMWENAYEKALSTGVAIKVNSPGEELTPNVAGHILEPSTGMYANVYGHYHNSGHGVFGSTDIPNRATTYMNDTATAVRDLIFYRWHRRIDVQWIRNNNYYRAEIAHNSPPVTITADDIMLSTNRDPPPDFAKIENGQWTSKAPSEVTCLHTYLGPPKKKFEWDNKISHEKFYYHLRMCRNADSPKDQEMPLTIRIFICPKKVQDDRRRWIEMDKFVCIIPAGKDHLSLTRADVHSSVIKRLHENMRSGSEPDQEKHCVKESPGFCECGWPYTMLLPRGKKTGEEYVLFVMATDNKIDSIGIRTSCGSMSYCGARGEKYPDSRNMGYPFVNKITYQGVEIKVPQVFDKITNAAYKTFIIENNVAEPPPVQAVDVWSPFGQLQVNDGTLRRANSGVSEYIRSNLIGSFRVLIDNDFVRPSGTNKAFLLRFQGRGSGGGSYDVCDVSLACRDGETQNIRKETNVEVKVKGEPKFTVPECGLLSDPITLKADPALEDYFLTFTLKSPGIYLPPNQSAQTFTYYLPPQFTTSTVATDDWSALGKKLRRFPYIQCVSAIMVAKDM